MHRLVRNGLSTVGDMTEPDLPTFRPLRIGIIGTGNIARALGGVWASCGHAVYFNGRTPETAQSLAVEIGHGAVAASVVDAVREADVVLLAVPWDAVDSVLDQIEPAIGGASTVMIDPTNPVEHGVGRHLLEVGSVAERIANRVQGARVIKAFNVHPSSHWEMANTRDTVVIAGDDAEALAVVQGLVLDVRATPLVLGGLDRARQIEELAGTVIALAFGGVDPRSAVPGF